MSSPAITTGPDRDIRAVAAILDEKRIKRLPVVDEEKRLVGIIARADIVRAMGRGWRKRPGEAVCCGVTRNDRRRISFENEREHEKSARRGSGGTPLVLDRLRARDRGLRLAFVTLFRAEDLSLLIGSFGASAVLVYGAIKSPLAQPRNLIGGHVISGLVGVACWQVFGATLWVAAALAVSLAIVAMLATKTLHPPGGATALIAVIGGAKIHELGFLYAFIPAGPVQWCSWSSPSS